jgi:hypothetical protein
MEPNRDCSSIWQTDCIVLLDAATILYHPKQIAEVMYYNSFQSSRAATILWGRLATCGRLAIGLPVARATLDQRLRSLRLAAMWGGLAKPAADCQSACRYHPKTPVANGCRLRLAALRGRPMRNVVASSPMASRRDRPLRSQSEPCLPLISNPVALARQPIGRSQAHRCSAYPRASTPA